MPSRFRRTAIATALAALAAQPTQAGWVNDWVAQKTTASPGYYDVAGQKIASFGAASYRWNRGSANTPILTFQRPSYRAGCGGIDLQMGGFYFAGVNQLVQKFQALIQNAPAIMFDMALSQVSQQLSGSMKWIEDLTDTLNGFSFDECSSAEEISASFAEPAKKLGGLFGLGKQTELEGKTAANADAQTAVATGAASDYQAARDQATANDTPAVPEPARVANCPQELQALLPPPGQQASMLEMALANTQLSTYADLFRGLIGDVIVAANTNKNGDTYVPTPVERCDKNDNLSYDNLIEGTVYKRPIGSANPACTLDDPGQVGIRSMVETQLTTIIGKLRANQPLTTAEQQFLDAPGPGPRERLIAAVQTNTDTVAIAEMTEILATQMAYQAMDDAYRKIRDALEQYHQVMWARRNNMADPGGCNIPSLEDVSTSLSKWADRAYQATVAVRNYYAMRVTAANQIAELNARVREIREQADSLPRKSIAKTVKPVER